MNELPSIDFSDLPPSAGGVSDLYRDYIGDFQKVRQYFPSDFRIHPHFGGVTEKRTALPEGRSIMLEVLREQNRAFGSPEAAFRNIGLLESEGTFAVVTGQQVGLAGGPLYTVYKTITALKLTARLKELFPQLNFVPVFWLEGEDHDLEEMNYVGVLNQDHHPEKVSYWPRGKEEQKNVLPVGEITFDEHIEPFFTQLHKTLPQSEFKAPLLESLREAYSPGATFNTAFARWMIRLFPDAGLVFISANDRRLKRLLAGVFRKEIENFPAVSQLIIQRSAQLENAYHAQIKTKAMNLFLYHKGGRYFIEPREHDFSLKGTRHYVSRDELLGIVDSQPELLSPNVALRPICQDTLFPTVAYVAGPSEVAYFAQLGPVYEYFAIPMPVVYPRISATLVEERVLRTIEKFELGVGELFSPPARVQKKVLELISEVNIDEMFDESRQRIGEQLTELKFGLQYIDQTLLGALETARTRTEAALAGLREKTVEAQKRRHEIALRQLGRTTNTIFPNSNFQERELNVIHFLNKYGPDFLRNLEGSLRLDHYAHQMLKI